MWAEAHAPVPDTRVLEDVSVLQTRPGVKCKGGDGSRGWRGERGYFGCGDTCTVVLDGYWARPEPLKVSSRAAKVARMLGFVRHAKLYSREAILERLPQDLQDMASKLG